VRTEYRIAAVVCVLVVGLQHGRDVVQPQALLSIQTVDVVENAIDAVVLTEDNPSGSVHSGCDSITVHSIVDGRLLDHGTQHVSPSRVAALGNLSLIATGPSNGLGENEESQWELNPRQTSWVAVRQATVGSPLIRDGFYTGIDAAYKGGLAFVRDGALLVATASGSYDARQGTIAPGPPFGVRRIVFPATVSTRGSLSTPGQLISSSALVGEILPFNDGHLAYLVSLDGAIVTIDTTSLLEVGTQATFPTPISPRNRFSGTNPAIEAFHATTTSDGQLIAVSRMFAADIAIVEMHSGISATIGVGPQAAFIGGVAFNNGWRNRGLLAAHAVDRIIILQRLDDGRFVPIGALPIRPPQFRPSDLARTDHGPQFSIAWSTDGSHLIFATQDGLAEFGVAEVLDDGRRLEYRRSLTACPLGLNLPNDIWTANGLITPTATPTPDLPPSATPTPSPTPSPTATPSPSASTSPPPTTAPSSTPSPTSPPTALPRPIYLPLALHLRCDPTQQRVDVALVLDASSSMAELTRSGRPKIDAALDAARAFLDLLALDDDSNPGPPNPDGDQAAIVAFHADAWLLTPLTDDRATLDTALDAVALGQQTRLDRAVAVGAQALSDDSRRRPGNLPVLVLLTDGRANPVPVDVAVAEAAAAKAAGVTLFTIGLGDDLDAEALAAMASTPAGFLRAPDAEDLAAVYAQVARSIPCARDWP